MSTQIFHTKISKYFTLKPPPPLTVRKKKGSIKTSMINSIKDNNSILLKAHLLAVYIEIKNSLLLANHTTDI